MVGDALPSVIGEPLALAGRLGELVLATAPDLRGELAALAALPTDWRERAARLAARAQLLELPGILAALAGQTAALRRAVGSCVAQQVARLDAAGPGAGEIAERRALAVPAVRLITYAFTWYSPAVAAVHAQLASRAEAVGNLMAIAVAAAPGADELADGHRDARHALDWVLAIPSGELALRRHALDLVITAVGGLQRAGAWSSRWAIAATVGRVAAGSDRAIRTGFAALTRGLPAASPERSPSPSADPPLDRAAIAAAIDAAHGVLAATQGPAGSWHGDYGGPLFLLPMYIGTCHMIGLPLDDDTRAGMIAYLSGHQNPDGGWGLDVEGDSHVFTSVLNYVALRLLGISAADPRTAAARTWFLARGGALASASWGKFFLAVLGLYDYDGVAPVPPELWLLPESLPVHPSRMWCHARMVYLPMSYLYGARAVLGGGELLDDIRGELYAEPYERIDWKRARDQVAETDLYMRHDLRLTATHVALGMYERFPARGLRERALAMVLDHIAFEDRATNYLCIGPVNKLFDLLVWHHARPGGDEVTAHIAALPHYLWHAPDGIKMQGYNSSELWDTAFAIQAIATARRGAASRPMLVRAAHFLESNQIIAEPPDAAHYYRNPSVGGWPFSTRAHGWPITDCTAEGYKATLALDPLGLATEITPARRADSIALMLGWQNPDGGWASYERTRGPRWLERLNPSEVFGEIMIDQSYVECSSACLQALATRRPEATGTERAAIDHALARGFAFLLGAQRADGSWEGAWGVCFTYGTWFAVNALAIAAEAGDRRARAAIDRACAFLVAHQQTDGGWGETVEACRRRHYIHAETGQAVMTSWALLTLIRAGRADSTAVRRGIAFLLARQGADGRWPAEHIAGVFNHTCAIHYDAYLRVFPLWALAAAERA